MEIEGSGRGGPAGPQETGLRAQGAEASPGHPHVKDTGPHTKACESTNREDSETLPSTPVLTRTGRRETPGRPAGRLSPARPSTQPASRTDPGTRGPWEFVR